MINLIPNKDKKEMLKGFYFRLLVLFLLGCGISIWIVLIALSPSYFLSSIKVKLMDAKLEAQQTEAVPLPDQQTLAVLEGIKTKLAIIEGVENNKFVVTEKIINTVAQRRISGIKITDISYDNDIKTEGQTKKVSIQGTAPSREVLLLFRQALEDDPTFKSVDLPISNFVKGSNIQFYLSLIPA